MVVNIVFTGFYFDSHLGCHRLHMVTIILKTKHTYELLEESIR